MKCPRCQQDNPTQAKFCLHCGVPAGNAATVGASYLELQAENEQLRRSLGDSAEQQASTAEILRAISWSPTALQAILDTVAATASRLCGAANVSVYQIDGDVMRKVAERGPQLTALPVGGTRPITRGSVSGRAILDRTTIRVLDQQAAEVRHEFPDGARQDTGIRTTLGIPLMREGLAVGAFTVYRTEPRPFSEAEIGLLQTFADQAVIAIENVRLFTELQHKNRALTESLEQQTATAEILSVISRSPTDVRPVFETILERAATLCEAQLGHLWLYEGGEQFRLGAGYGSRRDHLQWLEQGLHRIGRPFFREIGPWRVGQVLDVRDTEPYRRGEALWIRTVDHEGMRTLLGVPLIKDGRLVGSIAIYRREVRPFTDAQVALVKTFADQAVIAIENVRLFNELQEKNRALTQAHGQVTEALERQTATSEILGAISSSPTDVQPVFDSLVASAARLCKANDVLLLIREGDVLRPVAGVGAFWESLAADLRVPLVRGSVAARSVIDGTTFHIPDLAVASEADFALGRDLQRRFGHRTVLAVPLVREGIALGTIFAMRFEVRPFEDQQIALLKTFADQAVIAIENVRLFTELEARNRELTETVARETATGYVLRAISRAQTDAQPVFDLIAESAQRLCGAGFGQVALYDGKFLHMTAFHNVNPEGVEALRRRFPAPADGGSAMGRALQRRAVVEIPDVLADPAYAFKNELQTMGFHSLLVVPMLRNDEPIGAIAVGRRQRGAFADKQIELLKTFADQAVIAIENVRLFTELQTSNRELTTALDTQTATSDILRVISRSQTNVQPVFDAIVQSAVRLLRAHSGMLTRVAGDWLELAAFTSIDGAYDDAMRAYWPRPLHSKGGHTQAIRERAPINIADAEVDPRVPEAGRVVVRLSGLRSVASVPLLRNAEAIGTVAVNRQEPGGFTDDEIALLQTFADQAVIAIENVRLFAELQARTGESEEKSRQLEVASQHKSEFLANMSHELRTPLNAVIGFSEVLNERMFGELNEKQADYLNDIHASGQHLLSLINDILDLSKIEAGRMELELSEFNLPATLDNALTLVRERAGRRSIALDLSVDQRLEQIQADERKIRQVVLNLLSNAIKFTPEGGRIEVRAVPVDSSVEVSVTDTGVGIASEDQEAIFEEFKQVGMASKKVEGTGLGLALSRKFIELHGGRIWVKSQVGVGSTFTFTIPVRHGE